MPPFNAQRAKVQLKLAANRLRLLHSKKTAVNQQLRRDIATLLEQQKESSARIRVERIICEDYLLEALEQIELYCELLLARFGLLDATQHAGGCDPGIEEAVLALLYAAGRVEGTKELLVLRELMVSRFGREFVVAATENRDGCVDERLVARLCVTAPETFLVERYLEEIADSFNVKWRAHDLDDFDEKTGKEQPIEPLIVSRRDNDVDTSTDTKCHACGAPVKAASTADETAPGQAAEPAHVAPEVPLARQSSMDELMARLDALKRS